MKFSVIKPSVDSMSMFPTLQLPGATRYPTTVSSYIHFLGYSEYF